MDTSLENVCSLSNSLNSTINSFAWEIISQLSSHYLVIGVILVTWVLFELLTRNGKIHYNSANGFSPLFNSFVGSGLYFFYYSFVLILPEYLLGEIVHCVTWPLIHVFVFWAVRKTLISIGFWKY
jgi:hypothetical protein